MNLQPLLQPKTMAIVGVSINNDRHPANVIYTKNNLRLPVTVYPVNPRGGSLHGQRLFQKIADIPDKVDLAVIAVRADYCPDVLLDCIRSGVSGGAVISGGFAESGRKDLQERLVAIAREASFPFIGPNCLGIYTPGLMDTFFIPSERMVHPSSGGVAIVSQSGGVLVDQMVKFANEGVGLSLALSIGNKAVINEMEILQYLIHDPDTKVIAFYIEGFGKNEGRDFVIAAHKSPKPVIVLKSGKSDSGRRAVSSHTASLGGDYKVFSEVLRQYGIIEAKNELELLSFSESLCCYSQSIGKNIGIITGSGGHGALAVDICSMQGLATPRFSSRLQEEIRKNLSPSIQGIASVANPIDLTGSVIDDDFMNSAEILSRSTEIDCIVVLLLPYSPGITLDLSARLSQIRQNEGKPMIAYIPHIEKYRMLIEGFELNRIPAAPSIEGAILMAEALRRYQP
ncbi:MAG: CoA-binding protein [Deltaproteobacteria bacterium]|nr:CoA-binding protein [Deltaproteobacteria bacterium]